MSTILTNPSDTELNNAFDLFVTHSVPCDAWHPFIAGAGSWMKSDYCGHTTCHPRACSIDYCNHMEAVTPMLEKYYWTSTSHGMSGSTNGYPHITITVRYNNGDWANGDWFKGDSIAISFAHAAVMALLAVHGVTVKFTN